MNKFLPIPHLVNTVSEMMKTKHLLFTALFISATGCDFEDPGDDMAAPEPPPGSPICTPFPTDDPAVPRCDSPVGAPAPLPTLDLATGTEAVLSTDTGELTLPDTNKITYPMTIDESTGARSINLQSANIAAAATLHIRGTYPISLAVENDFRNEGVIVVEAGANLQCGDTAGKKGASVELATRSAGGGGGGAHFAAGGKGGIGVGNRAGGLGGVPFKTPRWLSGGCPGGGGGDNAAAGGNQGGSGGAGGGAIYVYSAKTITITGQIRANGKGGEGGTRRAGGGGGGSGGMIFLNGKDVVLAGATPLCANGGGGGEGGYQATTGKGDNGTNGLCRPVRAHGGAGTRGANGGQGGARDGHPGLGAANGTVVDGIEGGGGGGGGSAGPIFIRARYSFTLAAGTLTSPNFRRLP